MYTLYTNQYGQQYVSMVNNDGHAINIPLDPANTDYQAYLKWLDGYENIDGQWVQTNPNGNTPEPAEVTE